MDFNKEEIFNIVRKILGENCNGVFVSELVIECGSNCGKSVYSDQNCSLKIEPKYDCEVINGCTRLVIVPNDRDFVIKIPIDGYYSTTYTYSDGEDYLSFDNGFEIEDYNEADSYVLVDKINSIKGRRNPNINIMRIENEKYYKSDLAKELLLPNLFVGYFNNIEIYLQKKVDTIWSNYRFNCCDTSIQALSEKLEKKYEYLFGKSFCYKLVEYYGYKRTDKLMEELFNNNLKDLHYANIGMINNRPVIFDYGGYPEQEMWIKCK